MRTLYSLPYSPWSERARWVLRHHGLEYSEEPHVPLLGEFKLRSRARRWRGNVSVPLLVDGKNPVMDSLAIAEYCDAMGGEASLFPGDLRAPLRALNEKLEPTCWSGRAWFTHSLDDAGALELMPAALRSLPLAAKSARLASAFIARKHPTPLENIEEQLRSGFEEIRRTLAGRDHLYDEFTYGDIICATTLQFISPLDDGYVPLAAAVRRCWHHPALCAEFEDLIAWRDRTYRAHRPV